MPFIVLATHERGDLEPIDRAVETAEEAQALVWEQLLDATGDVRVRLESLSWLTLASRLDRDLEGAPGVGASARIWILDRYNERQSPGAAEKQRPDDGD